MKRTTYSELSKVDRKFILFGSGNISKKTIRKIGRQNIDFIVDNSENLQGQEFEGLQIKNPTAISSNHFVLICSTAISEISTQLKNYNFQEEKDFLISPVLNDLIAINNLEELAATFYFTSGTKSIDEKYGGGLYRCIVQGHNFELEKIYSGPCYGAIRQGDSVIFVDTDKGIHELKLSGSGKINHLVNIPKGSRAHGITYNENNNNYYLTCSYLDAVIEYSNEFEKKRVFKLSSKIDHYKEPAHHCNDSVSIGDSLFVSMFSSSGNWKRDVFDGCIAEFDLQTGLRVNDLISDLYMPHNVNFINGSIHVLDSLPGHLRFNNFSIQGTFPAFTRGLSYANGLYFVGQSKNRNYSKVFGLSNNISIDCGVIIFNPDLNVSRFLQFHPLIGEIHSIVI